MTLEWETCARGSGRNWYQMFTGYLFELEFEKAGEKETVFYITFQTKDRRGLVKDQYERTISVTYVDDTRVPGSEFGMQSSMACFKVGV